jgi:hypothetical protein
MKFLRYREIAAMKNKAGHLLEENEKSSIRCAKGEEFGKQTEKDLNSV